MHAKIRLSATEKRLMQDAAFILTKNRVLEKAKQLLGSIHLQYKDVVDVSALPEPVKSVAAKIAKGENYKGLPWLMLDYPRFFSGQDIFAIRTMFWWGNYFSITLHLSGKYKEQFAPKILSAFKHLKNEGFYINVHEGQWEHHYEKDNFIPVEGMKKKKFEKLVSGSSFIKTGTTVSLKNWKKAERKINRSFKTLIDIVSAE